MYKKEIVGRLTKKVIETFNLNYDENKPIFCGESNRNHMMEEHPEHYKLYGDKIEEIINNPDFIAKHPKKDSIEYIKVYETKDNDHVLVAVRASGSGTLFARTLFIMDPIKVSKYKGKKALKPYK